MAVMGVAEYYVYLQYFSNSSIGPSKTQVFLDFEMDLYRSSNGVLLLNDHTVKKEIIADDRVRFELLLDYKTNPLVFSLKKQNSNMRKMRTKLDRRIIYYKMIDEKWVKSSI